MATLKQKKAIEKIIENHGNVSKSMREVGYSDNTAKKPSNLTDSKGYKEQLEEYGLTDKFIVEELVKDIREKGQVDIEKRNRKGELDLAADIAGMKKREVKLDGNLTISWQE